MASFLMTDSFSVNKLTTLDFNCVCYLTDTLQLQNCGGVFNVSGILTKFSNTCVSETQLDSALEYHQDVDQTVNGQKLSNESELSQLCKEEQAKIKNPPHSKAKGLLPVAVNT